MAHAARISELVQNLTTSITGGDVDKQTTINTTKQLREHNFARTNQFAVDRRLVGLIEKFSVLDRDDLAEALHFRLDQLSKDDKFLPEKLALLLELSHLPHRIVHVDVLNSLSTEKEPTSHEPTWAEIVKDDPLVEDIWHDIERGYHSSGDEDDVADGRLHSSRTSVTDDTSLDDIDPTVPARAYLTQPGGGVLNTSMSPSTSFSELRLVRETLFMLRGLPSEYFSTDRANSIVLARPSWQSTSVIFSKLHGATQRIMDIGSSLAFLRRWCKSPQIEPAVRSCQAQVEIFLREADGHLSSLERELVSGSDVVVSMLQLCDDAERHTRPLFHMSAAIERVTTSMDPSDTVRLLQNLFQDACLAHADGDDEVLPVVSQALLVTCARFLEPLERWCSSGSVDAIGKQSLLVDEGSKCTLSSMWSNRVSLRTTIDGVPAIPTFLQSTADKLFVAGKSRMMYNILQSQPAPMTGQSRISLQAMLSALEVTGFLPYDEQLQSLLSSWAAMQTLRINDDLHLALIHEHALLEHFYAMDQIFFGPHGLSFSGFEDALFEHLDHSTTLPNDFVLTELVKSSLDSAAFVSVNALSMTSSSALGMSIMQLVHSLQLDYTVPWFMATVMGKETADVHSAVFLLLIQLQTTKHIAQQDIPAIRLSTLNKTGQDLSQILRLIHCLVALVDTLMFHITTMAADLGKAFRKTLSTTSSMDDKIAVYAAFELQLADLTLISTSPMNIRKHLTDILTTAEDVVAARRQILQAGTDGDVSRVVAALYKRYNLELESLIDGIREMADRDDYEHFTVLAELLTYCLPDALPWTPR